MLIMKKQLNYFLLLVLLAFAFGCVPQRHLEVEQDKNQRLTTQLEQANKQANDCATKVAKLETQVAELNKAVKVLKEDTTTCGNQYRKIIKKNKQLNDLYEQIIEQKADLAATASADRERLSLELADKKRELDKKQRELEAKSTELADKKRELEAKSKELTAKQTELKSKEQLLTEKERSISTLNADLEAREKRVNELESLLSKKDSSVAALRNDIATALLSFNEDELTVNIKDGKIYVSLAEQLLFKSGSTYVDAKGRKALEAIAKVLKEQPDIDVVVEGHTDNIPMKSASIKDNWDLSVLRATSIVRIMTHNDGFDSKRIIASGRGEHVPVANNSTKDGRAKNRRTEIILSPNLDKIFSILGEE